MRSTAVTDQIYDVLFLSSGNSVRSIMAEAILSRLGAGRFRAHSAGSHPKGHVHPMALKVLRELGYDNSDFRSKSWDEFAKPGAPALDFVITLCDIAVGEGCPAWPGNSIAAYCGIEDPAASGGPENEQHRLFRRTYLELEQRIEFFARLPIESLDRLTLQAHLEEIGKAGSATPEQR
jgi:arsenate reductase